MPGNQSFGVFPSSSAVRSRSVGDLQNLYFKTTKDSTHNWQTIPAEDRCENFDALHNIGKRSTKYMKFQKKVAPLVDRTACRYNMEFTARPLGDYQTNKELAITFAGIKAHQSTPSFGVKTSYSETFQAATPKQHKAARQPSQAPKAGRTQTLGGTDDFMEPVSLVHQTFRQHPLEMCKQQASAAPKPNLTMCGSHPSELFRSSYHRTFTPSSVKPAPDQLKWEDYMPAGTPWVLADDSIYRTRRACFLSPGN